MIPADEPAIDEIMRILRKHGFTEVPHELQAKTHEKTYYAGKVRRLEDEDCESAEYFCALGESDFKAPYTLVDYEHGKLGMCRRTAKRYKTLDSFRPSLDRNRLMVPDRVRAIIEPAWPEAEFWDVDLVIPHGLTDATVLDWSEVPERWWHVASSIDMPPLAPTTHIHSPLHGRVPPGSATPGEVREDDVYGVRMLRYRSSDLESMKPFGLGLAIERTTPSEYDRFLICSRAFYDWANELGLDFGYIPVGIDEE